MLFNIFSDVLLALNATLYKEKIIAISIINIEIP